jgi:N-acylneuraminate cytidylyltransferase/CMP-N,N'-diacetyllegionaminic acid synthase|tara:strand:+ start:3657 stop:4361 length:705 start_codon:yes stop_codon:yes gene_type:complete
MKKEILWLLAARSGSKSIPNKNIKLLGDHPLLSFRIKSVLKSKFKHDLWISTDSKDYALIAKNYGAEAPFLRPDELSNDNSSSIDVVLHAMNHAKNKGKEYDFIGLLEPTSPFIKTEDLDAALNLLQNDEDATGIVAVKESRPNKIFIQKKSKYLTELSVNLDNLKKFTRQSFDKEITPSGGFYISRWDSFISYKSFYNKKTLAYEVDEISGIEIDEPIDWNFAEFIFKNKLND